MFAAGEIESKGMAAAVLDTAGLASAKPGLFDRLIQGAYVAAGGSMATFEKAAGRAGRDGTTSGLVGGCLR
jgi:hypothetical protein